MKSNFKCWMLPAAAPLIVMLLLSACAMAGSDRPGPVCPPVVEYNTTEQARAADEVEGLPEGSVIARMLSDYSVIRDQAQTCLSN
jgi:hypothetical protein